MSGGGGGEEACNQAKFTHLTDDRYITHESLGGHVTLYGACAETPTSVAAMEISEKAPNDIAQRRQTTTPGRWMCYGQAREG